MRPAPRAGNAGRSISRLTGEAQNHAPHRWAIFGAPCMPPSLFYGVDMPYHGHLTGYQGE